MRKGMGFWQFIALISCFLAAKNFDVYLSGEGYIPLGIFIILNIYLNSFCIFVRIIDETFFNYCKLMNLCKPSAVCVMKSIYIF